MSEAIGIETTTKVFLSVDKVVKEMDAEDIGSFCSAIAERLDGQFAERAGAAAAFSDGLSEKGCRFLAEIVARFYLRQP
ncbi:conserved hypothetical protein [Pseudomonas sp. OF001]|uniref:hypothetical protein n=1 Tax=Pseudomonas sp. OF001 TaxID=2772300 RepID=UPI001917C9E2|nr:hypothetical protein [Pseudomonas sp. OF001]CAD5376772.1 conserved hypothetical protein [Pseudomonas sp. OF001]